MKPSERVLLVEDEEFVRESMTEVLEAEGLGVTCARTVAEAREVLAKERVDLVLTDLRLPGGDGMQLLGGEEDAGGPPVVMITGHGTVDDAVVAMKQGAYDFLQKPIAPEQLSIVVRRALEHGRVVRELHRLRDSVDRERSGRSLVGSSARMQGVRDLVAQVAPTSATVLIRGESGTGKELAAAEVHRLSDRAQGPLVLVNCAAVPTSLFESEFFGHRRGAYSGAHADREGRFAEAAGGTLVLDELHTLSAEVQAKLLRVLETGEYQMLGESRTRVVDTRIVAVTNMDLEQLIDDGSFRSDLYYRLNVFPLELPPLREHKEDLPEIAAELLARGGKVAGGGSVELDADALSLLGAYDWPGNVRELRNVLERAAILSLPGKRIEADVLRRVLAPPPGRAGAEPRTLNLRERLEATERDLLREALARSGGSRKEAARMLGLDPKNMSYYLRKHDLADPVP